MADEKKQIGMNSLLAYVFGRIKERVDSGAIVYANEVTELKTFDDLRYRNAERLVSTSARISPSVTRYVSLCMALRSGFRAAYQGELDYDIAKCKWLSSCLELMMESPLLAPANDWKQSLSVTDSQFILRFFVAAAQEMLKWLDAIQQSEPDADLYMFGPLALAIHNNLVVNHLVKKDGKLNVALTDADIFQESVHGNLQVEDRIIAHLHAACAEVNVAAAYREGPCPTECRVDVEIGKLETDYDHTWHCLQNEIKLHECWDALYARYEQYEASYKTPDSGELRRALFTISPSENSWFDYYVREYCNPTPYHVQYADEKYIKKDEILNNISLIEEIADNTCKHVLYDSRQSCAAKKMYAEWKRLAALFKIRAIGGSVPSYADQKRFCTDLSKFFELFDAAVKTIDQVENAASEKAEPMAQGIAERLMGRLSEMDAKLDEIKADLGEDRRPGVTLEEAAQYCGVVKTTISNWEKGRVKVPDGYPGRFNREVLIAWGQSYQSTKRFNRAARKRAVNMTDSSQAKDAKSN